MACAYLVQDPHPRERHSPCMPTLPSTLPRAGPPSAWEGVVALLVDYACVCPRRAGRPSAWEGLGRAYRVCCRLAFPFRPLYASKATCRVARACLCSSSFVIRASPKHFMCVHDSCVIADLTSEMDVQVDGYTDCARVYLRM